MSYYRAQMGDYKTYGYAGDPGFLSSLWKGVKSVAKSLIGIPLPTAPVPVPVPQLPAPPMGFQAPMGVRPSPPSVMIPGTGRLPPFTATGPGVLPGGGRGSMIPSGYHLDKKTGTYLVRNRRMNVANPRALRRAMRRTSGFVKLAKRALKGTGYAVRRA